MIIRQNEFIFPMFASAMPKKRPLEIKPGQWALEEKYDGHRIILEIKSNGDVCAYSRIGTRRELPRKVRQTLQLLPPGIYDGELLSPNRKSYGVTELTNLEDLVYVVFDILEIHGVSVMDAPYMVRRKYLEQIMTDRCLDPNHNGDEDGIPNGRGCGNPHCFKYDGNPRETQPVSISTSWLVNSQEEIDLIVAEIWGRGGEGAILKDQSSIYVPKKRPKNAWIKIKKLDSAVLTVIGFQPSRGEIVNRGQYAIVVLQDDKGIVTTVKTKNDAELAKFEREAPNSFMTRHPAIGRRLLISFQERTPDGNYREPRWDRWEDE